MINIIYVGLGGFIGAILRYAITLYSSKIFMIDIPIGTLISNLIGGLFIGIIMALATNTHLISSEMKLFLTSGLMGGLTTFSTFSYETINLLNEGKLGIGMVNILLNVSLSLIAVVIGQSLVK